MGFVKGLVIISIVLGLVWYFFPSAFHAGKQWTFDSFNTVFSKNPTEKLNYTMTNDGKDYGKAFGIIGCSANEDCQRWFKTPMNCSINSTCFIKEA